MESTAATAKTSPLKNKKKPPTTTTTTTTRENVHTNVLGIDAGDSELHYSSSKTSDSSTNNSNSASTTTSTLDTGNSPSRNNRRFVRVPGKETKSNSNKTTNTVGPPSPIITAYQPIASPPKRRPVINCADADIEAAAATTTTAANTNDDTNNTTWWGRRRRVGTNKVADANYECLDTTVTASSSTPLDSSFTGTAIATAVASDTPATTKEDRIKQSASFFYKGMEDSSNPLSPMDANNSRRMSVGGARSDRRNMRNIIPSSNSLLRNISSRHSRILSGRDGVVFMSKYERLNHDIRRPRRKKRQQPQNEDNSSSNNNDDNNNNDNSNNDLFLDEETSSCDYREHIPNPTNNVVMDATSLTNPHGVRSSLFYEQDGRMLMKLPRDQVRLVMDYDLEPGILSVEQWRNREDAERTAVEAMTAMTTRRTEREHRRQRQQQHQQQRRRQRRRQQLQQEREEIFDDDNDDNKTNDDENAIDEDSDPLKSEGGGQQPTEVIQQQQQQQQRLKNDYMYDDVYYSDSDNYDNENDYYDVEEDRPVLLPELSYVITVPPDLYQRLVGEMSAKAFPPYWGFFKCVTQDGERADIKLALFILLIVMLLLGAGSYEWPTD